MLTSLRHAIVKLIAPKVWEGHVKFYQLLDRPSLVEVSKLGKVGLVGAEIGVAQGLNAKRMFSLFDLKKLYLIDPYYEWTDL